MRFGPAKLVYVLLLLLLPGTVLAEQARLALVIGNSAYAQSPLKNPINDATDMATVLEELGFKVILSTDANRREMGRAIREFGRELKANRGVGLFYYAGHGMQIENRNYLIPIDTPLEEEDEVPYESIDVGSVLSKMESAGNALNLIILDACRNNPFPSSFRSTSRGLARVEAPIGSLVVYATAPGAVAADGDGRNGVFTGALLNELRTEGQSLTQIIRRTRAAVVKASNGQQVPWESSSLLKDFYFQQEEPEPQQVASLAVSEPVATTNTGTIRPAQDSDVSMELERNDAGPSQTISEPLASNDQKPTITRKDTVVANEPSPPAPATTTPPAMETTTLAMLDNQEQVKPKPPVAKKPDTGTAAIVEPAPAPRKQPQVVKPPVSTLTVEVDPPDARIRIMNIVERYKPGITLDRSRTYDVYITHSEYESYREMISLEDDATALNITLNKKSVVEPEEKKAAVEPEKKKGVVEPEMVAIAGGSYTMGCTRGDKSCETFEMPNRSIRINPFFISATEITYGQFEEFVDSSGYVTDAEKNRGGHQGCFIWSDSGGISRSEAKWAWTSNKSWRDPGYRQTATHPVSCVSWNDANRYAQWLTKNTGRNYALPSESEWEFAARAVSQGKYGKADNARELCSIANVADNGQSPSGSKWGKRINCTDNYWFSAPVASFQSNGFGLYDMQGNVWEWVADVWSDDLSKIPTNGSPNISASADDTRVLRGGGWDSDDKRTRLSSRMRGSTSGRASMTGFRLVIRSGDGRRE